jgi:uncharacterized protein
MIDQKLLDMLACPACDDRPPVRLQDEWLICDKCNRMYPIRDGIPDMLVESAVITDTATTTRPDQGED